MKPWSMGTQIAYREVWRGRIWTAMPVTVVQDTSDLIVLYLKAGTSWKLPKGNNFLNLLQRGEWQLRDVTTANDSLLVIMPGEGFALRTMGGLGEQAFTGWYVNLQEPLRRTSIGFDFMDHALDIVTSADLSEWHWKDEAELQTLQEMGLFSDELVHKIKSVGQQIIHRIETKAFPFAEDWEKWSPPSDWPMPKLPLHWDEL